MATPLKWNTPGLRWNAPGATWNGTTTAAATPRKMNKLKAITNFGGYVAAELAPVTQMIHDQMTLNAATFPAPPTTMAALQTLLDDFNLKLAAKASRATADIMAFNVVREQLEDTLRDLGNYVNGVAKGDPMMVEKSGFPHYETTHAADDSAPEAPADLRLRHGDVSGEVVARYKPQRSKSTNEVQKCTGDPAVEGNWMAAGLFQGGKATIAGLTPGVLIWMRVRTVGNKGVMGAWSDPAQIRVV